MSYCNIRDFIAFGEMGRGFYYLPKDNTIYKRGEGIEYTPVCKPKRKPIIKVINKEFRHKKIIKWVRK